MSPATPTLAKNMPYLILLPPRLPHVPPHFCPQKVDFVMFMQFLAILPNIFPHKSTTPNRKSCIVKRKFSCKKFAFFHFASFIIMKWNYYEMEIETRIMVHYVIIIYILYIYIYIYIYM